MTEKTKEQLGRYIERMMEEKEQLLKQRGKIKVSRKLSRNYMAKEVLGVSTTWFSGVINGENEPNDEMLLRVAGFLELDEHDLFKMAKRIHPVVLEEYKKEYLGNYYYE